VKKVEDEDSGEISEPEDLLMLQRDAKDWKVCASKLLFCPNSAISHGFIGRNG
jgi:hypothetical protein